MHTHMTFVILLKLNNITCFIPAIIYYNITPLVAQMVKRLSTMRETGFDPWVRMIPWRRKWQSTPVLLPGKSHGQRSLLGYSP